MLTSHKFSPRISVRSRNVAVDSTFVYPSYRGRVAFDCRVLHVVTLCALAAIFQRRFHLISAYLAIHIVDLHLYWWPLTSSAVGALCRRGAGSPLGVIVAPIFPIPSLLLVGVGSLSL